jgi:hypothetical protein
MFVILVRVGSIEHDVLVRSGELDLELIYIQDMVVSSPKLVLLAFSKESGTIHRCFVRDLHVVAGLREQTSTNDKIAQERRMIASNLIFTAQKEVMVVYLIWNSREYFLVSRDMKDALLCCYVLRYIDADANVLGFERFWGG